MLTERASGILLHPTSIPTRFGVGDLGPRAYEFLDWLASAHQRYWQVLPLCPADGEGSPYQSASSFAGNPLLISPELLLQDGLLTENELSEAALPAIEGGPAVDYDLATVQKQKILEIAARRLLALQSSHSLRVALELFQENNRDWLEPHAEFMAGCEANETTHWQRWPIDSQSTTSRIPQPLGDRFACHTAFQFFFDRQWQQLRDRAKQLGIRIVGDIPIYVSHDSADVWANRSLFQLNELGEAIFVAGVPPDYFAATGQLWNNPLYDWAEMSRDSYQWWIRRLQQSLCQVDLVRLDHFRGFEAFWSIPAGEATAVHGNWVPGPGDQFLQALCHAITVAESTDQISFASLPIIAEDLGMITENVHALRRRFQLPGMKVLQFMLPGEEWDNTQPEDFEANSVVYTGTHDNDTSLGWFRSEILQHAGKLDRLRRHVPCVEAGFAWEFIEYAWRSGSNLAITPLQDVLSLDSSARMNVPGTSGKATRNWRWKYCPGMLTASLRDRLATETDRVGR